ncbi:hypothetical protein LTR37_010513 [Vermiconidia calcicola]|uniref:Uncharacterized protein n=1 Tax=Vermiconidia calcicola TaxID=1690605 RepID=A0ACC3N606_9PEZI|nr:hypothetical protein LTR37_010513 [Vermiconidia calcicola]
MHERTALDMMRSTPTVEIPVLNKLKRKRTDSVESFLPPMAQLPKKPRSEDVSSQLQPSTAPQLPAKIEPTFTQTPEQDAGASSLASTEHKQHAQDVESPAQPISAPFNATEPGHQKRLHKTMNSSMDTFMQDAGVPTTEDVHGLSPLQQVIENEFNMQILMKHNELRLIEQELGKCQIALEQLRRCELRPFPGSNELSQAVSSGTGPSLAPPPGYTRPNHPPPYGVTDGPYSRHYKQWLLQDAQFEALPALGLQTEAFGRPTRNSGSARKSVSSKAFAFPGRPDALPNYPAPPPKDKSSPLVLRRSTDGQLVKLICNNCLRGNFSSIQGFLNHCRIAHKVDYKSHDAAAIDCGRTLDENEAANLPAETQATPAPKPSFNRAPTATSTSTPNRNLVHPFNTAGGASIAAGRPKQPNLVPRQPVPSLSLGAPSAAGSPFNPSPQVPRLSAHFAKYQLGGDLAKATETAKQKIDLGIDESIPSPDISGHNSPVEKMAGARTVAGGKQVGLTGSNGFAIRPPSRKGFRQPMQQRPRPSPLAPALSSAIVKQEHSEIPESPQDLSLNLSPHTADSNPGLVSDNEEDDHGSASEEEAPQTTEMRRPLPISAGNCADNMELDVTVDDDIDRNGVIIRRNSMFAEAERGPGGGGSPSRKLGGGKRSG